MTEGCERCDGWHLHVLTMASYFRELHSFKTCPTAFQARSRANRPQGDRFVDASEFCGLSDATAIWPDPCEPTGESLRLSHIAELAVHVVGDVQA